MISCSTCLNRDSCNAKYLRVWALTGPSTADWGCQGLNDDLHGFETYQREVPYSPLPSTGMSLETLDGVYCHTLEEMWGHDDVPMSTGYSERKTEIGSLYNQGYAAAEIGEILDMKPGAVWTAISRMKKKNV